MSAKQGYDSEVFVKEVLTSKWGIAVMRGSISREWCDEVFLLSGFERHCNLVKGKHYNAEFMNFLGYLYRYCMLVEGVSSTELYSKYPPKFIAQYYCALRQDNFDKAVNSLTEIHKLYSENTGISKKAETSDVLSA